MEEFTSDFQNELKPTNFAELNPNMELLNSFPEIHNQPLNSHIFDYLSSDNFLNSNDAVANISQPTSIPLQLFNLPESSATQYAFVSAYDQTDGTGANSSLAIKSTDGGHKIKTVGGRNKKRKGEEVTEKPKEVIHVRAKRGQATDSHSLAERVRREKINEKLKLLQDLVPGCYKTMGMAVMLDVIINYVRSLQNQIEFLSMKLSAASMFYDFNSPEAEAIENLQRTTNPCDVHEVEKVTREELGGTLARPTSSWFF